MEGEERNGPAEMSPEEFSEAQRRAQAASAQLLELNSEIRTIEHNIAVARRRRQWAVASLMLGPMLLLMLYMIPWLPGLDSRLVTAFFIPTLPASLGFCIAAIHLIRNPGGHGPVVVTLSDQYDVA